MTPPCDCAASTEGRWAGVHHPSCPAVAPLRIDYEAIEKFEATLPAHRLPWFHSLMPWDQTLLATLSQDEADFYEDRETAGGPGA